MLQNIILEKKQIEEELKEIPLWILTDNNHLERELVFPNFITAIGAINSIAIVAEKLDHHPDILLYGWNKVKIKTTTHNLGGLTILDFKLAKAIDELNY